MGRLTTHHELFRIIFLLFSILAGAHKCRETAHIHRLTILLHLCTLDPSSAKKILGGMPMQYIVTLVKVRIKYSAIHTFQSTGHHIASYPLL